MNWQWTGLKTWTGRFEYVHVDANNFYVCEHEMWNADDDDEKWYLTKIAISGDDISKTRRRGSFTNYNVGW